MEKRQKIESLCSYFVRQIDAIDSIVLDFDIKEASPEDLQASLYKKTLLLTMLDAIAGIRFSKRYHPDVHDKNQKRFTGFLQENSHWSNGKLISIPFLFDRLSKTEDQQIRNGQLNEFLKGKLSQFDTNAGGVIPIERMDEQPENLLPLITEDSEKKDILECQHYSILYRYRNHLVHEVREPGYGMDVFNETCAYYHGYIGEDGKWFLVYPLALLKQLCSLCINGLRQYLIDNQIDPDDIIEDTSRF